MDFSETIAGHFFTIYFPGFRGMTDFSDQFRKLIMRYKRIGYNLNVMRRVCILSYSPNHG